MYPPSCHHHHLVVWVVKVSTLRAADLGFNSRLHWDFSGLSHTINFNIDSPVATLPGAWCYRVTAGAGWPSVSILWLGETRFDMKPLPQCGSMYNNCLSRSIPEILLHVAGMLSKQATSQQPSCHHISPWPSHDLSGCTWYLADHHYPRVKGRVLTGRDCCCLLVA